ncbi:platelet endothelial cell adhesion molecule isoform X2 [Etheostoma spectabile]|uniref:platelet endothelial cell adhesion molecule isoform X2 n=1 Tax=Etheostoma spectabile TaxID=54343 RepID=UPI0013AF8EA7|nr:platelet endothelial cell adhesion molecule-like isoform X2 [Etheostoma spectabile]
MVPLLLLTSTLLSSYFHAGRTVIAEQPFTIRGITLSIEPSADVTRNTNVTLRCKAAVSSSGKEVLSREYTIYKDGNTIYTKTSSSSEDLLYPLPEVRVSNTGKYKCKISIEGKHVTSGAQKLTVTGLSKPVLRLNRGVVSEGEETTATCMARGETGSIFFYFYEDSKEIHEEQVKSNQAEAKLRITSVGIHKIHCAYTVLVTPDSFKSEESNTVTVSVKELPITPVLEIFPQSKIYEGDKLVIMCTFSNVLKRSEGIHLYLSQGNQLLSSGETTVNHSMVALAKDPGEFECRFEMGDVVKFVSKKVSVTELFSVPTFTMSPAEVFQKEYMTLTCKSERFASERLNREELTYALDPSESPLIPKSAGVFYGKALQYDFNYTCVARARGIVKHSETLTVRPKVSVSIPKISVVGRAVLGQPLKILCVSDSGSLPINYTLLREYDPLSTTIVKQPFQPAIFTVPITKPDEINTYMCEARNNHREAPLSKRLNATVIVPLTQPIMTVIPDLPDISEGVHLYLICGVAGTPPVTFKWYRVGNEQPLYTTTSNKNNTDYQVPEVSKQHSGTYYCEAVNHANNVVISDRVNIQVHMALWKKVVIGGFCVLAVSGLVVVFLLCFKSNRGRETYSPPATQAVYLKLCVKTNLPPPTSSCSSSHLSSLIVGKREAAAELSVKPSSPKSDDSLTVNLTHDTEVYKADSVRANRAAVSVWSERPPGAANDEESSVVSNEPDVEYTEVVHPRPVDPARGASDHHDYGSVEYAELNSEHPETNHYRPEVNGHQELPAPVD